MSKMIVATRASLLLSVFASATAVILSGCGVGALSTGTPSSATSLKGILHGGQQPVSGAYIDYFASSTASGYGGTLTPIGTAQTDQNGNFTITLTGTCPAGQYGYMLAAGGNPGLPTTNGPVNNTAAVMGSVVGPCSSITSSTYVAINEVTTVAMAYALSGFLPANGAGITYANIQPGAAMPGITAPATNAKGLADAFNNALNIVSPTSGVPYTVPPSNASGIVPAATINSLADIIQDCVNQASGSAALCSGAGMLFISATPPPVFPATSGVAPINTFQAALDIAQFPGYNTSALYNLISAQAAFEPTVAPAPNDWSIGIAYNSSTLGSSPAAIGIDSNDQLYVAGQTYLIDFSPLGAQLSTSSLITAGTSDSLRQIAIDKSNNVFVTDDSYTGVYKYSPTTNTSSPLNFDAAPANDPDPNTYTLAVDGQGDVWTTSYSKAKCAAPATECLLIEYPSTATVSPATAAYAPFASFPNSAASPTNSFTAPQPTGAAGGARGMAFDVNTGNIWITAINDNFAEVFNVSNTNPGVAIATAAPMQVTGLGTEVASPATNTACGTISVAIDSTSHAWILTAGGTAKSCAAVTAAALNTVPSNTTGGAAGTAIPVTSAGLNGPNQVVIDGNNNVFIANTGANAIAEYSPAAATFVTPSTGGLTPSATGSLFQPNYMAVDRAGALWTISVPNTTNKSAVVPAFLMQILGVAAPTDPVLADGKYGVKP